MECAKQKNKVKFDDTEKKTFFFFLDLQNFAFYHLFISKAQKMKSREATS